LASPFTVMLRFVDDLDRLFGDFGPAFARTALSAQGGSDDRLWSPPVEVLERDGKLIVRAEMPGLNPDQINLEITDDKLIISGEREQEHEERRGNVYRSERRYGAFYRVVPLPDGVDPEQTNATFENGVLEISMPVAQAAQPRRIEIESGAKSQQPAQPGQKSSQQSAA
jgi:HSP20 family protein